MLTACHDTAFVCTLHLHSARCEVSHVPEEIILDRKLHTNGVADHPVPTRDTPILKPKPNDMSRTASIHLYS
jgi:hypothetical protein